MFYRFINGLAPVVERGICDFGVVVRAHSV